MMMKTFKQIFTFSLLLFLLSSFTGITEDITAALKEGNAFKISAFFESHVDITILEESDLLSKLEAEKMIYDFFHENKPSDFKVLHHGENKSGLEYTIGKLITNNGNFRVTFYIKTKGSTKHIQQFSIDTE